MTITIPEFIGGGILLLLLNIAVWAFTWGRTMGKICERVDNVEEKVDTHIEHHPKPYVLPECNQTFTEIKTHLASMDTKLDNVIGEVKNLKKRVEA